MVREWACRKCAYHAVCVEQLGRGGLRTVGEGEHDDDDGGERDLRGHLVQRVVPHHLAVPGLQGHGQAIWGHTGQQQRQEEDEAGEGGRGVREQGWRLLCLGPLTEVEDGALQRAQVEGGEQAQALPVLLPLVQPATMTVSPPTGTGGLSS